MSMVILENLKNRTKATEPINQTDKLSVVVEGSSEKGRFETAPFLFSLFFTISLRRGKKKNQQDGILHSTASLRMPPIWLTGQ